MARQETAYCPTCRTMREVMDTYTTDDGDRYGPAPADRRTRVARPLECGHDAGDGGGTPPRARVVDDRALVEQVAGLQAKVVGL